MNFMQIGNESEEFNWFAIGLGDWFCEHISESVGSMQAETSLTSRVTISF
jgi:hypothetical protein